MLYKYFRSKDFCKIFYAMDTKQHTYFFEGYSWVLPKKYWQRATWKEDKGFIGSEIGNSEHTIPVSIDEMKKLNVPQIDSKTMKNQSPYKYFQDNEEAWMFFAKNENRNIYLFRDQSHHHDSIYDNRDIASGMWEMVIDEGFNEYCRDKMRAMSQSSPRTEEFLIENGIPLINRKNLIPCKVNHI